MQALAAGHAASDIAEWLQVSRQTVWRYAQAAVEQDRAVPVPRPMGGYRWSKLQRDNVVSLAAWALEQPKRTLEQLRAHAADSGLEISTSSVARALHKTGLQKRRARFVDARTQTRPLIAAERVAFRQAQRTNPAFAAERLLFYDETLLYLNEQARMAWGAEGPAAPVLHRPKGRSASTGLLLTLGLTADGSLLLHYQLQAPVRPFATLAATFQASELAAPGQSVALACNADTASVANLRGVLRAHGVRHTDLTSRAAVLARVKQLEATGVLGLPRAGRGDVGGSRQPVRNTVRDVAAYFESELVPWLAAQHAGDNVAQRTLVWDNASTHSPVQVRTTAQISLFHRLFREWGFRGCVFLPPRSPSFQPVEACFAFVKHWVRQWAPDDGYTQVGLEAAIETALSRVTAVMVRRWIRGCGYRVQGVDAEQARDSDNEGAPEAHPSRAPLSPRWADAHGTLCAHESKPGLVDVRARPLPRASRPAPTLPLEARRWPGFPGQPPKDATETQPAAYVNAVIDERELFEPERIVGERRASDGSVQYRIRWKGYDPAQDTWEPVGHLRAGRRELLRDWAKRQRAK